MLMPIDRTSAESAAVLAARPRATNRPDVAAIDVLVLDARLRQSLVTVRSLGQRGLRVAAVESAFQAPAFASRWCARATNTPDAIGTQEYFESLTGLAGGSAPAVWIPSHDGTIALLRQHRAQVEAIAHLALAGEPGMSIATDKAQTLDAAQRLGIRIPRGISLTSLADVPMAIREIGLPAVAKPAESWLWRDHGGVRLGPQLVTTADELRHAASDVTQFGGVLLLQQLLTGRREAMSFLYAHGRMHARFAQWARRTSPPLGGESVLRQSIAVPDDSGRQAEELVREIDLDGYSEVEFRRDGDGAPYLMEINPRLSASVEIAVRCGVDFPLLIFQWASGRRIDTVTQYRVGRWMRYLKGDLMATVSILRERGRPGAPTPARAALDFGLSFFRPMAYDYLDWHDPLPAVRATAAFTREAAEALLRAKRHR